MRRSLALVAILLPFLTPLPGPLGAQESGDELSDAIVFIPIEGDITERLCRRVSRDIAACVERGSRLLVLRFDTLGGEYIAASELATEIYDLRNLRGLRLRLLRRRRHVRERPHLRGIRLHPRGSRHR